MLCSGNSNTCVWGSAGMRCRRGSLRQRQQRTAMERRCPWGVARAAFAETSQGLPLSNVAFGLAGAALSRAAKVRCQAKAPVQARVQAGTQCSRDSFCRSQQMLLSEGALGCCRAGGLARQAQHYSPELGVCEDDSVCLQHQQVLVRLLLDVIEVAAVQQTKTSAVHQLASL